MASTYSPLLRLELIAAGEQAGLWGNTTNGNLGSLMEQAIAGTTFITMSTTSYTLSALNGTVDEARAAVLVLSGTPGGAASLVIPTLQKTYVVKNATNQTVTIKTSAQVGGVALTSGNTVSVFCDGTDCFPSLTPGVIGAPTTAGVGATGTWPIAISGNAATATLATTATTAGTVTNGVYTTDLTTGVGTANKIPKYDARGVLGMGTVPNAGWTPAAGNYGMIDFCGGAATIAGTSSGNVLYNIVNGYVGTSNIKSTAAGYVVMMTMAQNQVSWTAGNATAANQSMNLGSNVGFLMTITAPSGVVQSPGGFFTSSDRRLKTDIKKLTGAMDKLAKISGYTYDRSDIDGAARQIGVMADEIKAVLPEAVTTGEDGFDRVSYGNLAALFIECIKSQDKSITKLQERLRLLEAKVK